MSAHGVTPYLLEAEMQHEDEKARVEETVAEPVTRSYEPPIVAEAGAFAEVTHGGSGKYREAGVGRFL
ncbi:lasso RiPP family leader peptide-containing protein [Streptomyces iconiensis]|uniref:Lasso RiPP family leader peptide-containing protein n=1 Tax=Streptomyces iconiensis TaxID=1384038 RepID=A0ABT6ZV01_9ACTN|nr:lasso RiPP family leader peptide-containing protein [Streptomyces iconiensis]MDJ1132893.1 lasso RiPP family leader peptide-containing protein [Streptomyces iconiensis]